jgi:ABC-type phosphate/phosphonate transport system substrate-binding protein
VGLDDASQLALQAAFEGITGLPTAPVVVPCAALLSQLLDAAPETVAIAPSLVATELMRARLGSPVAVARRAGSAHSAVLIARRGIEGVAGLAGRRVGWVSKLSSTGYQVPRMYLESFGLDLSIMFGEQRFLGSHEAAASALASGAVDVIATHSGRARQVMSQTASRTVASIGPIPADLVVAGMSVPLPVREALSRGLSARVVGRLRFSAVRPGHLDLYEMLRGHAGEPAPKRSFDEASATTLH